MLLGPGSKGFPTFFIVLSYEHGKYYLKERANEVYRFIYFYWYSKEKKIFCILHRIKKIKYFLIKYTKNFSLIL